MLTPPTPKINWICCVSECNFGNKGKYSQFIGKHWVSAKICGNTLFSSNPIVGSKLAKAQIVSLTPRLLEPCQIASIGQDSAHWLATLLPSLIEAGNYASPSSLAMSSKNASNDAISLKSTRFLDLHWARWTPWYI